MTSRSRESITAGQLPPVASVAPVSHTMGNLQFLWKNKWILFRKKKKSFYFYVVGHQATLQPQQHMQTQQVNVSNTVPVNVNVTSATPSHVSAWTKV